jgi:hypothetical protein
MALVMPTDPLANTHGSRGEGTSTNLCALPATPHAHDEAAPPALDQIWAKVDIAKGGVTVITRAAEHEVFIVGLMGK